VVLYLHHAATLGYKDAVVRTPGTDIFVILLYHAHKIKLTVYLDTGSRKHRQLINISELAESLGEDYCGTLLRYHSAFRRLGDYWNVGSQLLKELEQFTCLIYGQSCESSVDVVRHKLLCKMVGEDKKLTSKSKVDLARLPPCNSAPRPHIQRVNHRVCLYKRADDPIVQPCDEGQG